MVILAGFVQTEIRSPFDVSYFRMIEKTTVGLHVELVRLLKLGIRRVVLPSVTGKGKPTEPRF